VSRLPLIASAALAALGAPLHAQGPPPGCVAPAVWPRLPLPIEIELRPSARAAVIDSAGAARPDSAALRASVIRPQYAYFRDPDRGCLAVIVVQHMGHAFGYRAVEGGQWGGAADTLFTLVGWAPATR